jgi:hypothetical protein
VVVMAVVGKGEDWLNGAVIGFPGAGSAAGAR